MRTLRYLDVCWFSLVVLLVSASFTTSIHSRNQRDLQNQLNRFEIAIQRLLRNGNGCGPKAKSGETSLVNQEIEKLSHDNVKFGGDIVSCKPRIPAAIDMAFQPQKQRSGNEGPDLRKFNPDLDEESEARRVKHEKPSPSKTNTNFDSTEDNLEDGKLEKKYFTKKNINGTVEDGKEVAKNIKKDFGASTREPKKHIPTKLSDTTVPDAIDLAFKSIPRQGYTSTTAPKPTTSYWPPTSKTSPTANQICKSQIDLGFLVESSKSVAHTGPGNYRWLINFVKHVVLKFKIGPEATRVGLISFAERPVLLMGFNDGERIHDVLRFLNIPCHRCWNAQTGLALSFAASYLFDCHCNPWRKRVLVVLTDGSSSDGILIPSRILKQNGVHIVAIGVGRYFNIHQLNAMASHPVQKNVFTGEFSKINYVINDLVRQICNVAAGSMVPSRPSPCKCP